MSEGGSTVRVTRIPLTAIDKDLLDYLEGAVGKGTIFALEILTESWNWKSKGHCRIQFESTTDAQRAWELCRQDRLRFQNANLEISFAHEQIVPRPLRPENRLVGGALHAGSMVSDASVASFAYWEIARAEVMPERKKIEFWVEDGGEVYRLEIQFGDIVSTHGLFFEDQNSDAILFREVQEFFVNHMINDSLGAIANAHLVHADREPEKARSAISKELAMLHSEAVDFAKTGAEAEMAHALMPKQYPDSMNRSDKPSYASPGVLGILCRATLEKKVQDSFHTWSKEVFLPNYDTDLQICCFEKFLEVSLVHKEQYESRLRALMHYYGAESEHEILCGNLKNRAPFLEKDKRKFTKLKDRVLMLVKNLQREAKSWFESSCRGTDCQRLASACYLPSGLFFKHHLLELPVDP